MSLANGSRLGPYEILAPLGAGGMGEVYKARDTRLGREVAIKVLPADRVADPDRKARFIQEARAASSLNHPNIVTIHDIAQDGGVDFLVMEYVPGKTLDQVIARKGLPIANVLRYGVTLADALAKAHAAGIVHRDLKPGNVMITADGVLKVLDFGLAKLADSDALRAAGADGATLTIEGTIVGTAAYMSPEQAEGKAVDARSDIFSFGCVLYEMLTGRRAFSGDTQASTLAAVLREEPKPVSQTGATAPRDLERIIQRCMRKDPARRFQHMGDVKVELEELKEESDSGTLAGPVPVAAPRRRGGWMWAAMGAAALALVGTGAWLKVRPDTGGGPSAPIPLVTDPGGADTPTFSPDGNQVAYSWDGENQDNRDIYVRVIGAGKPLRLTSDPAVDTAPAWSPDGRNIAFIRGGRGVYLTSALGGGEQKIAEDTSPRTVGVAARLAWTPDGKFVASQISAPGESPAIFMIGLDGEKRRLTAPPEGMQDLNPAFSPDGKRLAFIRCGRAAFQCALYVENLSADYRPSSQPEPIVPGPTGVFYPVWTAGGQDLVYAFAPAGVNSFLMRIRAAAGAKAERISIAGLQARSPAISARGNRLAYAVDLSDIDIRTIEPGGGVRSLAASTRTEFNPQYSPDGSRIAFGSDRSGVNEIWVCDADGSNPVQLTHFADRHSGTPRWSPDGRFIAFDSQAQEGWRIFVLSVDGGQTRRLTSDQGSEVMPSWSADGKWVYFSSDRTGAFEVWKAPAAGGKASQVTHNGGSLPFESRDGRSLFYVKDPNRNGALWMQPAEGGPEKKLVDSVVGRGYALVDDGIYYLTGPARGQRSLQFYRFATGASERVAAIPDREVSLGLTVSPDRKRILYSGFTRVGQNLMLVENFK